MIQQMRVVAYDPWGERRGVVPAVTEISIVQPLNAVPTGEITYTTGGVNADLLRLPVEISVEIWDGETWKEPPNARFFALGEDIKREAPSVVQLSLHGIATALNWATVWVETPGDPDMHRVFDAQTPGSILSLLLGEARARKDETGLVWAPGLGADFDREQDSAGAKWARNARAIFNRSDSLLKVVEWLAGKGAIDWRTEGRTLRVFQSRGGMERHLTGQRLRLPFSTSMPVQVNWENIATVARFAGDEGVTFERSNPAAARALGRVERWSEQGNVKLAETANLYLDELLLQGERPAVEYRREWAAGQHESQPYPWQDYSLGDWVLIDRYGDDTELRVVEIQLKQDENGGITGAEALGTRIQSLMEKLARRTTDLSSGQVGSENGKPAPVNPTTGEPRTGIPQGLVLSVAQTTEPLSGAVTGIAQASWNPVPGAEEYELQALDAAGWGIVASTKDTGASFPTTGEGTVTVRVRAIFKERETGPWSAQVTVNIETGETVLPKPTPPAVSSRLGIVTVTWDGKTVGADGQPSGLPTVFSRLEIAATPAPTPPTSATQVLAAAVLTRAGTIPLTGIPAGTQVHVFSRIVDVNGKTGGWQASTPASLTVKRVEAADLEANNISANTAVMGTLMAGLANILKLNVGQVSGEAAEFATAIIDKLKVQTAAIDTLFTTLFKAHKIQAYQIDANFAEIDTLYVGGYKIDPVALQNMGTVRNPVEYGDSRLESDRIETGNVKINRWGNGWIPRLDGDRVAANVLGLGWQNGDSINVANSIRWRGSGDVYLNAVLSASGFSSSGDIFAAGKIHAANFTETSTAESKFDPEPVRDLTGILGVEPVAYRSKALIDEWRKQFGEPGPSRPLKPLPERMVGWRAEDLEAAGLGIFVTHNLETGAPEGVEYSRLSVALWQVARRQQQQLDRLEARLASLESRLGGEPA
ncbi:hypothetical protein [Mobiluncus curtisii]|uniref:hypothetical protein n=1 Tax=Mobiluncus curtisii TaxID=2051 RepID=UPI00146FD96D|nr:hypothetical protein [Mobiluncus curtisii]NMW88046.1 hypothetical protein [Mobiluncus curtisii]